MMTLAQLRYAIIDCGNSVYFTIDGLKCGVEPSVENSVFTFEAWYGNQLRSYNSFDAMVQDKLFGGRSLADIVATMAVDLR